MADPHTSHYLHLPLTLQPAGFFERAATEEDVVGPRLRLFILSGAGEYLRLPSPGMRSLWIQLYTIGVSSRFCDSMKEDERRRLEETIRGEVNHWMLGTAAIESVSLIGDKENDNGIKFSTSSREFVFYIKYTRQAGGGSSTVGPWYLTESSRAIF